MTHIAKMNDAKNLLGYDLSEGQQFLNAYLKVDNEQKKKVNDFILVNGE